MFNFPFFTSDIESVAQKRVNHWYAWLIIGIVAGFPMGVVFVANQSGDFETSLAGQTIQSVNHVEDIGTLTMDLLRLGDELAVAQGTPAPDEEAGGAIGDPEEASAPINAAGMDQDGYIMGGQVRDKSISGLALERAVSLAKKRQALMQQALEKDDAATVLKFALPMKMRNKLPQEVQAFVETEADVSGEFTILHSENVDASGNFTDSRYFYSLKTAGQEILDLHFAGTQPQEAETKKLLTGARVRVKGVKVGQAVAALGADTAALQVLAAAVPNTFGAQKTAVILVRFQDKPTLPGITPAEAHERIFATSNPMSTTNFFREVSYGQAWLEGDVYGIYTIPMSSAGCNTGSIAFYAKQAATAEVGAAKMATYRRFVYSFHGSGCWFTGLGTVGGNPSQAWIPDDPDTGILSHEMGHNFGLYHSHSLVCDEGNASICSNGRENEYGDNFDSMGSGGGLHFNAAQKERLGWLNYGDSPPITTVNSSGEYTIDPYQTVGSNPKALKVKTPSGDWYYMEYRQALGFDASTLLHNHNVTNGVLVHRWFGGSPDGINLIFMTVAPLDSRFPAVEVGSSFSDPASGITITPISKTGNTISVSVTKGGSPPPCTRSNPTISIAPLAQFGKPGDALSYAAAVTNNDTSVCATSNFSLSGSGLPFGWTISSSSLNLVPGASSNTAVIVTSPVNAAAQSLTFTLIAKNSSETTKFASATATYNVQPTVKAQCEDGIDNDGDGKIDYPADPGCLSASDTDESDTPTTATMSDDFNRTNSTNLGAKWQEAKGGFSILNNELRNDANITGSSIALASGISGLNLSASAKFAKADTSGTELGLVLRYQDANNYYRFYRKTGGTSVFRIGKVVNGVETVLKGVATSNPTTNTFFTLEAKAEGTKLTLYLNGVKKIELNDTTFSQGGVGLNLNSLRSQRVDNFSASVLTP